MECLSGYMFKNKVFLGLIILVVLGVVGYTFFGEETTVSTNDYIVQLEQERKGKDQFFLKSEQSPLEDKTNFKGLNYFTPNPAFKIVADVIAYDSTDKQVAVAMTDGSTETYQKYGFAVFTINDTPCKLLIYQHDKGLSILFRDATTPEETYGGGRYLDFKAEEIKNNQLAIDFNKSYNPYCAYNHRFACPLPPKENTLALRVEAGEKIFDAHD